MTNDDSFVMYTVIHKSKWLTEKESVKFSEIFVKNILFNLYYFKLLFPNYLCKLLVYKYKNKFKKFFKVEVTDNQGFNYDIIYFES